MYMLSANRAPELFKFEQNRVSEYTIIMVGHIAYT